MSAFRRRTTEHAPSILRALPEAPGGVALARRAPPTDAKRLPDTGRRVKQKSPRREPVALWPVNVREDHSAFLNGASVIWRASFRLPVILALATPDNT